ncbi:hypothetical protein [Allorhizocola rhizosphaerae]|uniref:hypothetical protein n=1 Tax=Allorhizocola rhizosphaerae TaxID=1872709 RepID=UPI000E3DEE93|nr:hypothetical protein [Allorhizocola rhizosphaerae]
MGRIVKQLSDNTSKYYWYPGEKQEWIRALVALAVGGGAAALVMLLTRNSLTAVVIGCAATLIVAGFNFGRRDAKAVSGFPKMHERAAKRAAIVYSGRAAWRGMVQGLGAALAAVVVLNVVHTGWVADWVLPLVPGVAGAMSHQLGMVWDRLGTTVAAPTPAKGSAKGSAKATETAPESN